MSLLLRTLVVLFLLIGGNTLYAQELPVNEVFDGTEIENEEVVEERQNIDSRVVRINPESEMIEASERIVENFLDTVGEKASQERATQIDFVLEVFIELNKSSVETLEDFIPGIDAFIESGIERIRLEKPQSPFVLRRLVDSIRDDVYIEMMNRISDPSLLEDPAGFEKEIDFLKERLGLIENTLEVRGEVTIDLEIEKDIIIASFNEYGNSLIEANRRLSESGLLSAISDDDQDGLSDFTEEIITLTDKTKKSTIGGPSTDAESLLLGKNASDLDLEDTVYVDISKNSSGAYLSLSRVDYVEQKKSVNNDTGNVFLRGLSVPASVVYGYIYPENIVFVTQTDRLGLWEHALTRSLEDGEYVVQLAHLEANGNPITRSKSFNFIHEGGSTYLEGQPIVSVTLPQTGGRDPFLGGVSNGGSLSESPFMAQGPLAEFIREYFLIIVGGLAVLGVLVSFILVKSGMHRRAGTYYSAMSSDGPTINQAGGRSLYGSLNTSAAQAEG